MLNLLRCLIGRIHPHYLKCRECGRWMNSHSDFNETVYCIRCQDYMYQPSLSRSHTNRSQHLAWCECEYRRGNRSCTQLGCGVPRRGKCQTRIVADARPNISLFTEPMGGQQYAPGRVSPHFAVPISILHPRLCSATE